MSSGKVLSGHSRALDGVRAFAVLAVMAAHAGVPGARGGGFGVLVFFVLSGFLITTLLCQERDRTGRIRLGYFYMRRALRLFPALVAVIVATELAVRLVLVGPNGEATEGAVLPALFYYSNWMWFAHGTDMGVLGFFGHFWSLSVEEQFYLLWPPVLIGLWRQFGERAVAAVLAVICVGSLVIRLETIHGLDTAHLLFGTHAIADQLAWGALLAMLLRMVAVDRARAVLNVAAWPAAVGLVLLVATVRADDPGTLGVFSNTVALTLAAVASAVVIGHIVTRPAAPLARLLALRPLAYIGKISYGMYLWHILVLNLVVHRYGGGNKADALMVVLTVIVATCSYYGWEQWFLRLKVRRFQPAASEPLRDRDSERADA